MLNRQASRKTKQDTASGIEDARSTPGLEGTLAQGSSAMSGLEHVPETFRFVYRKAGVTLSVPPGHTLYDLKPRFVPVFDKTQGNICTVEGCTKQRKYRVNYNSNIVAVCGIEHYNVVLSGKA